MGVVWRDAAGRDGWARGREGWEKLEDEEGGLDDEESPKRRSGSGSAGLGIAFFRRAGLMYACAVSSSTACRLSLERAESGRCCCCCGKNLG